MSIKVKWDYSIGVTGLASDMNRETGKGIFIFPFSLEEYAKRIPDAFTHLDMMKRQGDISLYRVCDLCDDEELRLEVEGIFNYDVYCDLLNSIITSFDCYPVACVYKPPKKESYGGQNK